MKRIITMILLVILIPYALVNIFIKEEDIKFIYQKNMFVRVKRTSQNIIDTVPFEEYITGVLAGEMPVSFELEALKAQAVAARSYVMKKMNYNKDKDYDIVDTALHQVYIDDGYLKKAWGNNYTDRINKIKKAILETEGEYVAYKGEVAEAFFFSTSWGITENSEDVFVAKVPYLRSVSSEWDEKVSPVFNDDETFTLEEFYKKLGLEYHKDLKIEVLSKTDTGLIKKLKINGTTMTANSVSYKLGLRSSYFSVFQYDNTIKVKTKGYGHGVGMSQYGAQGMAKEGYTYDQILKHYYQGVEIEKI